MNTIQTPYGDGELVSIIDGTENILISNENLENLNPILTQYIEGIKGITEKTMTLADLEKSLRESFEPGKEYYFGEKERFASAIGWKNTQLHRSSENIIIPGSKMEDDESSQHNISGTVVDPIGWASRAVAPNDYGLLGKIPEFRGLPGNKKFDQELYKELFNTIIRTSGISGYAIEGNSDESVVMPIVSLEGGEKIINEFSEALEKEDIPTAKYYGLNK